MEDTDDARADLLKRMRSTDPKELQRLMNSVDTDRVDELVTLADGEPLERADLSGPITNGSSSVVKKNLLDTETQPGADVPDEPDASKRPDMVQYRAPYHSPGGVMTLCSFTCDSGIGSDVVSRTVSCAALPPHRFFCPRISKEYTEMDAASEPLLAGLQQGPYAGDAVPSADDLDRAEAVRQLNSRIIDAVRAGDKDAVLSIYENENLKMLWEAYQDLVDNVMTKKDELDKFENDFDELVGEDEWKELFKRRPALSSLAVKCQAYRMKKNLLG
mmetsp:Transcript_161219/g.309711  ORF Transcript_161219/g.309711 Transcript_161219/m.309711 type:complete len:274 (-) Transcript_161219:21-842(-)